MTIETVLRRHYLPTGLAGTKATRAALIRDLQRHYRLNIRLHLLVLVLLLIGIAVLAIFVVRHMPLESKDVAAVVAALAAAVGGAIEIVRRVTREWSQAKLLVSVVQTMSDEQAVALVAKLLEAPKA